MPSDTAARMNSSNEKITAKPLKVVLAEKYSAARDALAALLEDNGCELYEAENQQTAIRYIQRLETVSVLLVDLEMAGWRSIVSQAVRRHNAFVIAIEGDQAVFEMEHFKRCGIHVYLKKPIIYDAILMAIRQKITGEKVLPEQQKLTLLNAAQFIRSRSQWPSRN